MEPTEIINRLRADYAALITSKERGEMVEISTPHATLSSKFVRVYVGEKNGRFIVSDQYDLADNAYEADTAGFKGMGQLCTLFQIEVRCLMIGRPCYYREVERIERLSSAVFDVAQFVQQVVNLACLVEEATTA